MINFIYKLFKCCDSHWIILTRKRKGLNSLCYEILNNLEKCVDVIKQTRKGSTGSIEIIYKKPFIISRNQSWTNSQS